MGESFSFTWGLEELENLGHVEVFEFMLDFYSGLGITRQEMLCIIHLTRYHYNMPGGESRPALETIAKQMGYGNKSRISDLVRSLENKGMLIITRNQGKPSIYNAYPFARKCFDLWLESVAQNRNGKGQGVALERNTGVALERNQNKTIKAHHVGVENNIKTLTRFGVAFHVAQKLAGTCDTEQITGWIQYTEKQQSLRNKVAFLVSRLQAGEQPPTNGNQERKSYTEGLCAECWQSPCVCGEG